MRKNVVLDFTSNKQLFEDQPLAILPAELAKKLLRSYESQLTNRRVKDIIHDHVNELKRFMENEDLDGAQGCSLAWLQERDLIDNVAKERWDAYAVSNTEPAEV